MIRARGELGIQIADAVYPVCLTLGALAEIESVLESDSLGDLSQKLSTLTGQDIQAVLSALLRGGGVMEADYIASKASPNAAAVAVAHAFAEALT